MAFSSHIPNMVTSCNLLSGVVGLFFAFAGRPDISLFCMLAAGIFDFFDGALARALHCSGEIGRELDSLSDLVSFGVLPAVLLTLNCLRGAGIEGVSALSQGFCLRTILCFFPLLIAAFSALRLAKFNLDQRQHSCFLGLPTPSAAIFCASITAFCYYRPSSAMAEFCSGLPFTLLLSIIICALLVCEIPFFAFKSSSKTASEPCAEEPCKATTEDAFKETCKATAKASEQARGRNKANAAFSANIKRIALLCIGAIAIIMVLLLGWNFTAIPILFFGSYILENLVFALFGI